MTLLLSGPDIGLDEGLFQASGPIVLRKSHQAVWTIRWPNQARNEAVWSLRFQGAHRLEYRLRLEAALTATYGDLRFHRFSHRAAYGDLSLHRKALSLDYWLTESVAQTHRLDWAVTEVDPVRLRFSASWSLLGDFHIQAVANSPEMTWKGRTVRILQARLSTDEDSPVWLATLELAEIGDFAGIAVGDEIRLALGLETFVLVVDGKTLSRESVADTRLEITAASPLALLEAPFAGTMSLIRPESTSALSAVEDLIGPVVWNLPDWIIPAGRLMLENVTPLSAARNIVAAIGGLIESRPDGTVVCRRRHPVSIPEYGAAAVDHSLFDSDVLSAHSRIAPHRGYNRVTLANEDSAAGSSMDRIEYLPDSDDPTRGTVRAYLAMARPVLLTHTGHAATVIESLGEVTRSETETAEFVIGAGSVRYPVTAVLNVTWQHADLGAVTADGESLIATTLGYSLGVITYTTTSLDWRVVLEAQEEVQFVLVDA